MSKGKKQIGDKNFPSSKYHGGQQVYMFKNMGGGVTFGVRDAILIENPLISGIIKITCTHPTPKKQS